MRPAPRTAIPSIFYSHCDCYRRRPKAMALIWIKIKGGCLNGFAIWEANLLEMPHRRFEDTPGSHIERKLAQFSGNQLDPPIVPVAGIQDGLNEGGNIELAFTAQLAVMGRVVEERLNDLLVRIVEFDRQQAIEGDFGDFVETHAAARHVPDIDQQATIGIVQPVDECQAAVDRIDAGEGQELDHNVDITRRRLVADGGKGIAHPRQVRLALLEDAAPEFDLLDGQFGTDVEQFAEHRVGRGSAGTVEMPVDEKLQLDVLDAIVGEDALDRREAELLDGVDDVGMNEPQPTP